MTPISLSDCLHRLVVVDIHALVVNFLQKQQQQRQQQQQHNVGRASCACCVACFGEHVCLVHSVDSFAFDVSTQIQWFVSLLPQASFQALRYRAWSGGSAVACSGVIKNRRLVKNKEKVKAKQSETVKMNFFLQPLLLRKNNLRMCLRLVAIHISLLSARTIDK